MFCPQFMLPLPLTDSLYLLLFSIHLDSFTRHVPQRMDDHIDTLCMENREIITLIDQVNVVMIEGMLKTLSLR